MISIIISGWSRDRFPDTFKSLEPLGDYLRAINAEVIVGLGGDAACGLVLPPPLAGIITYVDCREPKASEHLLREQSFKKARGELLIFFEPGVILSRETLNMHIEKAREKLPAFVVGSLTVGGIDRYIFFNNTSVTRQVLQQTGWPDARFHVNNVTGYAEFQTRTRNAGIEIIYLKTDAIYQTTSEMRYSRTPRRLETLAVWITDRCNLRCIMCKNASMARRREPSLEELCNILREAKEIGVKKLELAEGEPMLSPHFIKILEYATLNDFEIGFVTNGTLITQEIAAVLASSNVGDIPISLDGPEIIHDRIRGQGVFKKIRKGIAGLQRKGVKFSIFSTISRLNLGYLPYMVHLAADMGAMQISFQPVSPIQAGKNPGAKDLFLRFEDLGVIKNEIEKAILESQKINMPIRSINLLLAIPEFVASGYTVVPRNGCTVPQRMAYINRDRNLLTCYVPYSQRLCQKYKPGLLSRLWYSKEYDQLAKIAASGSCPGCLANCSDIDACYQ